MIISPNKVILMKFYQDDKITIEGKNIYHKSAGGFMFYEEPNSHELFVALIRPENETRLFIPKGHLKNNETPHEAAEREICEELTLSLKPTLITELGVDHYSFTLEDVSVRHFKDVFLFVFSLETKEPLKALKSEKIAQALWVKFEEAANELAYDKENLLKARQLFYFYKPTKTLPSSEKTLSITVGIPTFNGQNTIYRTLESVVLSLHATSQSIKKEIIVCLDHCSDDTQEQINLFKERDAGNDIPIKVIENRGHNGKPTAMNTIFEQSNSDLLYFVDDDIVLDRNCVNELIRSFIREPSMKCFFSRWIRSTGKKEDLYKRLWREILGVKFDVQPFEKPSEYLLGGSILLKRADYVYFPWYIANEDQFLQYIFWPKTRKINSSFVYFNSVNSLSDYYRRFIRIMGSSIQLRNEFSKERIRYCSSELHRKIDYKKVLDLPFCQLLPFISYRLVRAIISVYVSIRLSINKKYVWRRVKQNV